eukprot:gene3860-4811_t
MVGLISGQSPSTQYPSVSVDKSIYLQPSNHVYVVYTGPNQYSIVQQQGNQQNSNIVLIATYDDTISTNGWGKLNISDYSSNLLVEDHIQSYLAGFVEGVLTAPRIYQMYTNFASAEFKATNGQPSNSLTSFMNDQLQWVRKTIQSGVNNLEEEEDEYFYRDQWKNADIEDGSSVNTTIYWYTTSLLMAQFDGMVAGYQGSPNPPMTEMQLYLLTAAGDLQTLIPLYADYYSEEERFNWFGTEIRPPKFEDQLLDCSALIRVLPGNQDVYFGHTTWRYYYGMLRIYKYFNLHFQMYGLTYVSSFSSSPGFLSSKDDFYVTGHQLAVMETTNNIFNNTLFAYVIPQTLFVWQRAVIANILATTAQSWTQVFQLYNSGTYNNQWMVFDYKQFTPGSSSPLPANSFWILEQIPGPYCQSADMTGFLNQNGFWPSYNIPYFPFIYNISGYPTLNETAGNPWSYELCPRALIFKRNASQVLDFQDMQDMLQFNNYKTDPLSLGTPLDSISSRADLLDPVLNGRQPIPFGGVDSKITSSKQISNLGCTAISGPTRSNNLPAFRWSSNPAWANISHIGLPDVWDFDWVDF